MVHYDYLIVGAGLYGATFAHLARKMGKKCMVIEKQPHTGGNLYCENVEGINVHVHGAHIFHTSNKRVWDLVNEIVPFNRYTNSPLANYQGKLYNLPINMNTFYQMWGVTTPQDAKEMLDDQCAEAQARMLADGIAEPRNLEERALLMVGRDIYERLIKGYTEKRWGRPCDKLPANLLTRLPSRPVFDNNYFDDTYQGIPIGGYNKLIEGLLEGVEVRTGVDFLQDKDYWEGIANTVVYTGPIDAYFDFAYGPLAYRTLNFETEVIDIPNFQGNAIVNYTEREVPYTRIFEHKHFEMFGKAVYECPKTVITHEYAVEWEPGMEPYYPVDDEKNETLYEKYQTLASQRPNVLFCGRLGTYQYYDMDETIAEVMRHFPL